MAGAPTQLEPSLTSPTPPHPPDPLPPPLETDPRCLALPNEQFCTQA